MDVNKTLERGSPRPRESNDVRLESLQKDLGDSEAQTSIQSLSSLLAAEHARMGTG